MPITTLQEVNDLLGYTTGDDATRDAQITRLIPIIQDKVLKMSRSKFLNKNVQITGQFAFVAGTPDTITDASEGFIDADIIGGKTNLDYRVRYSKNNNGIIEVASLTAGTLTLTTNNTVIDEDADNEIIITQTKWPDGIAVDVANVINYYLTPKKGIGVKSENLPGGYSVTYRDNEEAEIFAPFKVYG